MDSWKETTIGELVTKVTKGTTPKKGKGFVESDGINYIKSDAVSYDGRIDVSKFVMIDEGTHDLFKRSQLEEDDILFSMAGAFLGKTGIVKKSMLPANTNQALAIIRLAKSKAIPKYVGYFLRRPKIIDYVNNMSGQSAQPNINFQEIRSIELNLPPLPEQKAIAEVLSSLDDKIDLLHRQNKTLEAMAETLFRQWFVEEADESWEEKSLSEIATFLNGLACQKYPPTNAIDKLPVLKIRELKDGFTDNSDWASTEVPDKYFVSNGDVIFSWSASLLVKIWDGSDCILNQHLFKVTSEVYPKWFYYLWSKYHLDQFIAIARAHATTMGHIKRGDLDEAMVFIPPDQILQKMDYSFDPIIEKIIANNKQLTSLTKLRDTLLPKLMSGEVRVKMN